MWNRRSRYYMDNEIGAYRRYHNTMNLIEAFLVRIIIFAGMGFMVYLIVSNW